MAPRSKAPSQSKPQNKKGKPEKTKVAKPEKATKPQIDKKKKAKKSKKHRDEENDDLWNMEVVQDDPNDDDDDLDAIPVPEPRKDVATEDVDMEEAADEEEEDDDDISLPADNEDDDAESFKGFGDVASDDEDAQEGESEDEVDGMEAGSDEEQEDEDEDDEPDFPDLGDSDDENEEEEEEETEHDEESGLEVLKKSTVQPWIERVKSKKSISGMRKLLVAFRAAARMSDDADQRTRVHYKINDPEVFNLVVTSTLQLAPIVFNSFLHMDKAEPVAKHKRWNAAKNMVQGYLKSLLHLLQSLSDPTMIYFAVKESEKMTKYWASIPALARHYLKALLKIWSSMSTQDNVRIQSFLAIRALALSPHTFRSPQELLETCLKSAYLEFVRGSKRTNTHTLPAVNMMRNMAVQLFVMDQDMSYQLGFLYIRQLAITLRTAIQDKSKKTRANVCNWQFIHCIDLWANVFASTCQAPDSPLRPLIYPLVQVALGTIKFAPSAAYLPLRFHILHCMTLLSNSTKVFIPLAPYLLELFESAEFAHKAKPSTLKPLEWEAHLHAPKQYLHGRVYQDGAFEQLCICLNDYYKGLYSHISYPELSIPAIVAIKRFLKKSNKNVKGGQKLKELVQKVRNINSFGSSDSHSILDGDQGQLCPGAAQPG
ncbi:Noc2p family-domain-containing protein [Syncephalastrum racemosum]|uniref:Noc2p family-domain-containing protein n=1 Tax=Syncephalastrum racemosum TaxID=13706 RepID=A0A1X2H093_SYNRA|nr:Noc2p family-domain-containing protein [Syncephalastrum racemosum]